MATLGSQSVGSIVKLNVNGVATNFIVVHQGLPGTMYDSSCDGTWLLMEDIYVQRSWDSSDNDYGNSDIHSYLNNTFASLFDSDIKDVIKEVKIPYTKGKGYGGSLADGSNGLSAKVFLMSWIEMGYSGSAANAEGATVSYFKGSTESKRIAKFNGKAAMWFLRSPNTLNYSSVLAVGDSGFTSNMECTRAIGVRPALVLPSDFSVAGGAAITGSIKIGGVQRELTGKGYINIGGVLRELSDAQVKIGGTLKSLKG
jgi:hypothetical protein